MPINQIQRILLLLFLFCFLIANISYAQKTLTSEEAYAQDLVLKKINKKFKINKEFHYWYLLHLQRMDLMDLQQKVGHIF